MRRLLLRLIGLTAAIVAAALAWVIVTLPPAAIGLPEPDTAALPPGNAATLVTGAYHIHSTRSDGSGSVDDIALAAQRAGLQFIIVTDHGDATSRLEPTYRHGVLCLDAVEVSTAAGHVVALGLTSASPFPLAGEPADVIEDIHRLGGVAVAAHPDSPRPALSWRARGGAATDGLEWFNADSEWRVHPPKVLAAAAARALFRPAESVAALFGRPQRSLERWDAAQPRRPTFAIAALDAHARIGADREGESNSSSSWMAVSFPGYETMFRTVAQTVRLDRPLSGEATADAATVIAAIAAGRSFSVVRAYVDAPRALAFRATGGSSRADFGGRVDGEGPVTFHAAVPRESGARLVLFGNGREVASGPAVLDYQTAVAGFYRVEARLGDRPTPWIVSNAIQIGTPPTASQTIPGEPQPPCGPAIPIAPGSWVIEKAPSSTATISDEDDALRLQYQLGGGVPSGQYVALASGASGDAVIERIEFTATSERPLRISLQVRSAATSDQRWRKSVYLDQQPRRVSVALAELDPVDRRSSLRPLAARVHSILLVIDTVNAKPGDSGDVRFRDVAYRPPCGDAR